MKLEPYDEDIPRKIMHAYMRLGRRPAAVAYYLEFSALLKEEFGARPEKETIRLYNQIRDGTMKATSSGRWREPSVMPGFIPA